MKSSGRRLGRGLDALIPQEQQETSRPVDVFFGAAGTGARPNTGHTTAVAAGSRTAKTDLAEIAGAGLVGKPGATDAAGSRNTADVATDTARTAGGQGGTGEDLDSIRQLLSPRPRKAAVKGGAKSALGGGDVADGVGGVTDGVGGEAPSKNSAKNAARSARGAAAQATAVGEPVSRETISRHTSVSDTAAASVAGDTKASSPADPHTDVSRETITDAAGIGAQAVAAGNPGIDPSTVATSNLVPVPGATFGELAIDSIIPNRNQPRSVFDPDELADLAASIKEVGVLQPIVVRPLAEPDPDLPQARYELIMGERRWRASQLASIDVIPAIVRRTEDTDMLRDALLENLHRAQLNPLEEAAAYQQLLDDFGCTQEQLATKVSRSRPHVANTLRLLRLPAPVQRRVAAGVLSAGHARALLSLATDDAMDALATRIVAEGLSVRSTEEIVTLADSQEIAPSKARAPRTATATPEAVTLQQALTDLLDTRVRITTTPKRGRIVIDFAGADDLQRISSLLLPSN